MIIKNKKIGIGEKTYFIADIAANHDGDLGKAIELIKLCAEAGACLLYTSPSPRD